MSETIRLPDSRVTTALRGGPSATEGLYRLAEAEGHVAVPHLMDQLIDDLPVEELERAVAPLDQGDGHAQGRKDRGVFDPDHAGPHDGHRAREVLQLDHLVGVEDHLAICLDPGRGRRLGADGDDDVGPRDVPPPALPVHGQRVRVHERRLAREQRHVVATELALDHLDLARDDRVDTGEQLGGRGAAVHAGPWQAIGAPGEP